jgi:hypothetical protein
MAGGGCGVKGVFHAFVFRLEKIKVYLCANENNSNNDSELWNGDRNFRNIPGTQEADRRMTVEGHPGQKLSRPYLKNKLGLVDIPGISVT